MIQRKIQKSSSRHENKGETSSSGSSSNGSNSSKRSRNVVLGECLSLLVFSSGNNNISSYISRASAATILIAISAAILIIFVWAPRFSVLHHETAHFHALVNMNQLNITTTHVLSTTLDSIDKRPSSKFSKTWNFTAQQQAMLEHLSTIFGGRTTNTSFWQALHGLSCQQSTYENLSRLIDYISSLDLYIVSHGGIGSNALIHHLDQYSSLNVKTGKHNNTSTATKKFYDYSCHLGNPAFVGLIRQRQERSSILPPTPRSPPLPPTLVVIGDFWNAFCSMKRRGWLNMNIAKNLYASQYCRCKWEYNLLIFPTDPAGIKIMMLSHMIMAKTTTTTTRMQTSLSSPDEDSPIVFLQAPYTRESIMQALGLLLVSPSSSSAAKGNNNTNNNVQRHIQGFEVRPREQHYTHYYNNQSTTAAAATATAGAGNSSNDNNNDDLHALYKPYLKLEDILSRMPRAWKASDTPRELYDYLLEEFQ